jgi:ankyrin repeat protein
VEEAVAAVKDRQYSGRGPLHMAAWAGRLEMCKFLVKDLRLNVDAPGDEGNWFVTSNSSRVGLTGAFVPVRLCRTFGVALVVIFSKLPNSANFDPAQGRICFLRGWRISLITTYPIKNFKLNY